MQSLPAPAWRLGQRASRRRRGLPVRVAGRAAIVALALALLGGSVALAIAVGGDGGSRHVAPAHAGAAPVALIGGQPLQSAHCADWTGGTDAQRAAIVAALRQDVGGATGYGPAATLSDDRAAALLTNACSSPVARNWLLYELYIRAAGFQSARP